MHNLKKATGLIVLIILPVYFSACSRSTDESSDKPADTSDKSVKSTRDLEASFGDEYWANERPDSLGLWRVTTVDINGISMCNDKVIISERVVSGTEYEGKDSVTRIRAIGIENGNTAWSFESKYLEDYVCGDNNVYTISRNVGVDAVRIEDGSEVWTFNTNPTGNIYYEDGQLFFIGSGILYSIDPEQKDVEWKTSIPSRDNVYDTVGPLLHDNKIVLIYNHNSSIDTEHWFGNENTKNSDEKSSSNNFSLHIFDKIDGSIADSKKISGRIQEGEVNILNGNLYIPAKIKYNVEEGFEKEDQEYIYNIDLSSGTVKWKKKLRGIGVLFGESSFSTFSKNNLKILDHESGDVIKEYNINLYGKEIIKFSDPIIYFVSRIEDFSEEAKIVRYNLAKSDKTSSHTINYPAGSLTRLSKEHIFLAHGSLGVRALYGSGK